MIGKAETKAESDTFRRFTGKMLVWGNGEGLEEVGRSCSSPVKKARWLELGVAGEEE